MNTLLSCKGCSFLLLLSFFLLSGVACEQKEPIKIGFSGGLTGRHSELGLNGRNGALLAIEQANTAGGVRGRKLKLLTKDDQQDPEMAVKVDRELIDQNVAAIIGHFTSTMTVAALPQINKNKVLLFSPTASTSTLSGIDDYFLRVMAPTTKAIDLLYRYIFEQKKHQKLTIVYDAQNTTFASDWTTRFLEMGGEDGKTISTIPFISGKSFQFSDFAQQVLNQEPEGLLIIGSSLDSALLSQQVRKLGSDIPIFITMWAMSDDFLEYGGTAVEGIVVPNWFDPDYESEKSHAFHAAYKKRFSKDPTFASHFSYETASIIIQALKISDNPDQLKETILKIAVFEGTQGTIKLDKFGDSQRKLFLMTVDNGKFVKLK